MEEGVDDKGQKKIEKDQERKRSEKIFGRNSPMRNIKDNGWEKHQNIDRIV